MLYQIFVFDSTHSLFNYLPRHSEEIFIHEEYLAVFKNKQLYYYQNIDESINPEQLISHLQKTFQFFSLHEIKSLGTSKKKRSFDIYFKASRTYGFLFFCLYFSLLMGVFYFMDGNTIQENQNELQRIQDNTLDTKKILHFDFLTEKIFTIYEKAQEKKLYVTTLSLKDAKMILLLESKVKQNIYDFLQYLDENSVLDAIRFDEQTKRFTANAHFFLPRK